MTHVAAVEAAALRAQSSSAELRLIRGRRKKPLARIRNRWFNRLEHAEAATLNILRNNGHAEAIKAATRAGAIDWEKLIELILKYLPIILAFFK